MNKIKTLKIIEQLIKNCESSQIENTKLYITSWIVFPLQNIENKINGKIYYPYNATYKELFNEFVDNFMCKRINEKIKDETMQQLFTTENLEMVLELEKIFLK